MIGDVRISSQVYIGHGAILRGDYGTIVIGEQSAVEEGAIIHINPGVTCELERRVTIGAGAIVAEGAVVSNGKQIPAGIIVAGSPAHEIGKVTERHQKFWDYGKDLYVDLAKRYPAGLQRLE